MSKVKLQDSLGRVVQINGDATEGATVGKNLFGPDGKVLQMSDLGGGGPAGRTPWETIDNVPHALLALSLLTGFGYPVQIGNGEWRQRTFQAGGGIKVINGNGRDGDTSFQLEQVVDLGDGQALVKVTIDQYGRTVATASANTDDLAEGSSNRYFTDARADARADARIAAQKGAASGIAPLDAGSKIPTQYLPALAVAGAPPPAMTLAAANALTGVADFQIVAITDLIGGRELCWYDATVATGTKWRRFSDRSIAS